MIIFIIKTFKNRTLFWGIRSPPTPSKIDAEIDQIYIVEK